MAKIRSKNSTRVMFGIPVIKSIVIIDLTTLKVTDLHEVHY